MHQAQESEVPAMTPGVEAVAAVARGLLPEAGVITDRARLRTYECDGLAHYRVTPALVVVPEDAAQLAAVVRACAEHLGIRATPEVIERVAREHLLALVNSAPPPRSPR